MSITDPVTAAQTANLAAAVGEPCVLLKLGEIFLKGKNRQQFVRMQQANVRAAVRNTGVPVELTVREGVLVLRLAHGDGQPAERLTAAEQAEAMDRVAARVADVPGIVRVCRALLWHGPAPAPSCHPEYPDSFQIVSQQVRTD